jgi:hypothetical protein
MPSTAQNRYSLAGKSGDKCLVLWDQAASEWVVVQVSHHEIEVPLAYRYYEGHLQAKHRKIAVMYCEDETDWRDEIELVEADMLDSVRFTGCGPTSPGDSSPGTGGTEGGGGTTGTTSSSSTTSDGCGSIESRTAKAYFFAPPVPQAWVNVLSFQEQAVLIAAAGSGNCIVFQEATVCTPCVGAVDTTRVCATVGTTVTCQCTCNCGDSGGYTPSSGGGSNCSCSCVCQASSSIIFG